MLFRLGLLPCGVGGHRKWSIPGPRLESAVSRDVWVEVEGGSSRRTSPLSAIQEICMYVYMYVYVCYECTYVCVYVVLCMYIYVYI